MNEYLEFAKDIARTAGDIMLNYFCVSKKVKYKSDRTPVTIADKKINRYLINQVKKKYPYHSVQGEEESLDNNSNYVWVCDPIDGTSMYTRHVPVSVFSLALVVDGEPVVGVIYDPYLDDMYTAIKGENAYLNDKIIKVNDLDFGELGATVDYCMWNGAKFDTLKLIEEIRKDVKLSQVGSVAHAAMLVARGAISASIFPGTKHGNCDIAASKLIVEEAGGKVTDFYGNNQRYDKDINGAIISNGEIHDKILKKVKTIYK